MGLPRAVLRPLAPLALTAGLLSGGCGVSEGDPLALESGTPVVLIVVDTLRADHLSCYGYGLETSPVLDEFSRHAFLFEANTPQCNVTNSSLASILTGLYVKTHRNYLALPLEGTNSTPPGVVSLAERFSSVGYETLATLSTPHWIPADTSSILARGWDDLSVLGEPVPVQERAFHARARFTNERLFAQLDRYEREAAASPLFLWAHYYDPHTDLHPVAYDPPPSTRDLFLRPHLRAEGLEGLHDELAALEPGERIAWLEQHAGGSARAAILANGRACYDAEIRACDAGIGELFERLRAMGLYDEAVIVVMADHGENLEDDEAGHGPIAFTHARLYEPVAHTPLIIKLPHQREGVRVTALSQNIDVAATLLDLLGLPASPPLEGRSLVPLLRGSQPSVHDVVFIESSDNLERAVKSTVLKYVDRGSHDEPLLFDLDQDPEEREPLESLRRSDQRGRLQAAMAGFRPRNVLRIHLEPGAGGYEAALELELPHNVVEELISSDAGTLSSDGTRFTWRGHVGSLGVDHLLVLDRPPQDSRWRIRSSGCDDLQQCVRLGSTPVERTPAIPQWRALDGEPPSRALVMLSHDADAASWRVELPPTVAREVEVEARYAQPAIEKRLELAGADAFGPFSEVRGRMYRAVGDPHEGCRLDLRHDVDDADLLLLVRIDGTWPDARAVLLDGQPVVTDELQFALPFPPDGRIASYLLAGCPAKPGPASITIWLESGGEGASIDTAGMRPELVEQLRALGYVGDG